MRGVSAHQNSDLLQRLPFAVKSEKSIVDRQFVVTTLRDLVPSAPTIGLISNLGHAPQPRPLAIQRQ